MRSASPSSARRTGRRIRKRSEKRSPASASRSTAAGGLGEADLDHLPRVVPLVHGRRDVEAFVALQPHEIAAERAREDLREFGLADAGLTLEEQRPAELQRKEDGRREAAFRDVVGGREQRGRGVDGRGQGRAIAHRSASAAVTARFAITPTRCARYSALAWRSPDSDST